MNKLFFTIIYFCCAILSVCAQQGAVADTVVAADEEYYDDDTDVEAAAKSVVLEKPVLRRVSDDSIRALKALPAFAYMQYADSFLRKYQQPEEPAQETGDRIEETEPSASLLDNSGLRVVYWGIAIAVVVLLLWSVFRGKGSLFGRSAKQLAVVEEAVEEDITGRPLEQLIEKAIRAKDYRLAIRYLYLHTLEILGEKQLVSLAPQKTNYQYMRELNGQPYAANFSTLTLQYEYVWYGEFKLDEQLFGKIHDGFKKFKSQLV